MDSEAIKTEIKDILIKLEETNYLLKDGKQILAYNKVNGIKEKLRLLYKKLENKSEENQNS